MVKEEKKRKSPLRPTRRSKRKIKDIRARSVVYYPHTAAHYIYRSDALHLPKRFYSKKKIARILEFRVAKRERERAMALTKAKEIVSSNSVVVFSKTYCPYCVSVKQLLTQLGAKFKAIELDTESDGAQIQSALGEWSGQRTVPNVFIGGNHIGGCDTTTALHKEGKLVPLLSQAGAVTKTSA